MNKQTFLNRFYHQVAHRFEPEYPLRHPSSPAAVLIPVVTRDELSIILTRRALHLKHHPGQISFPGGRYEPADQNLQQTALRETREEIGLIEQQVEIIGVLPSFKTISRYQVTPYIGLVEPPVDLQPDPDEVAEVFEVPLEFLINKSNHQIHWVTRNGKRHPINMIVWEDQQIWGVTAAFILNLSNIINS
ncbi:CoA pyrophosphatase [Neptunicella sp. SCSIO 80796]|uniref:CoA pyrophosphatase n=1 Tax=Neptunicella plasticusilytica TaxID=3117012 RepID=UPI003A4D2799